MIVGWQCAREGKAAAVDRRGLRTRGPSNWDHAVTGQFVERRPFTSACSRRCAVLGSPTVCPGAAAALVVGAWLRGRQSGKVRVQRPPRTNAMACRSCWLTASHWPFRDLRIAMGARGIDDDDDFFDGDDWLKAAGADDPLVKTLDSFQREGTRRKRHAQRTGHVPVQELDAVDKLMPPQMRRRHDLKYDGVYVDGTFGRGGHSRSILSRLSDSGRLFAFDVDPSAVAVARDLEREDTRFHFIHQPFGQLGSVLAGQEVNGVLLDIGVSNNQVEEEDRGFYVTGDTPLDLRMNQSEGIPASEWLQSVSVEELAWVIHQYGEDQSVALSERIAEAIIRRQDEQGPYQTSTDLADVVRKAKRASDQIRHPAKLTFQAIRMFLNHELDQLRCALAGALDVLAPGGRCVVITFKSLESQAVNDFIQKHEDPPEQLVRSFDDRRLCELYPLVTTSLDYSVKRIELPTRARRAETMANPRARSSSLIVMRKDPRLSKRLCEKPRSLEERLIEPTPPPFVGAVPEIP